MPTRRVLFICTHNSARSQMAEAFLKSLGGDRFEVHSAGLEPTTVNPMVVRAMGELGFDLSENRTKNVFDFFRSGKLFDYVITVCRESLEQKCPVFPGITRRLHWGFDDPAAVEGTDEEKMEKVRAIRDAIRSKIADWLMELEGEGRGET
ncbi:MAG: arsenate reductase ArsC [Deltaproteobacteria bacterium]|nr:arsenate reductase ArsC [Deltaproteobacteria bacterium]